LNSAARSLHRSEKKKNPLDYFQAGFFLICDDLTLLPDVLLTLPVFD
jgi:hypothetical protein